MRISLFAHRLVERHPTGLARYLRELAQALAPELGTDDRLLLASTPEPGVVDWAPPAAQICRLPWRRRAVQLAWSLGSGPVVERGTGPLDVVHLIQPFPPARSRSAQVITIHDLFPYEHPEWYPRSERWAYRSAVTIGVRRAARVVVPSHHVSRRVTALLGVDPSRIDVVAHGVSGVFCGDGDDDAGVCARFGVQPGRYAVCVGAVSTRKNVLCLVRAMREPTAPAMPLLIVGADGEGAELVDAELSRRSKRRAAVRTGYLPDGETAALVRQAAALVHPALAEGFGLVPLEAMAAGTAVVAARTSAVPEVVGEAAILVDEPTHPRSWAAALARVGDDPALRARLAHAGLTRARDFSWPVTARAMLDVYTAVADG